MSRERGGNKPPARFMMRNRVVEEVPDDDLRIDHFAHSVDRTAPIKGSKKRILSLKDRQHVKSSLINSKAKLKSLSLTA